ncbi:HupE/UreJ family protein [Streptomyces sp. NPDC090106]|uniref:HupE/UreJ family protein n=1 Tax=Streptomyces sp. NPDC090106 TaxID=3365946 RepID=UPI003825D304
MSQHFRRLLLTAGAAVLLLLGLAGPSAAHGFSSTVYLHATGADGGRLRTALKLEYDLLVVSAADSGRDDALFQAGTDAFDADDTAAEAAALNAHRDTAVGYVTGRLGVTVGGEACTAEPSGGFRMGRAEGVPYALLDLDWTCPERHGADQEIRSGLFPDSEEYVTGTKTIVTYTVDGHSGSAALDSAHPSFSVERPWTARFVEFFRLGAEHLLTGTDHILFLIALIAGSRRPREVVLAATAFTVAHSVTFLLAALGLVDVPARIVEPVIALSIAVVAGWHLWRLRRPRAEVTADSRGAGGPLSLDRAGWARLGAVFCFGLVHGLGFAGALGIDAAWSWTLLWSLLVFNVGIEAVQLGLIALTFPLLALLRRRSPRAAAWVTGLAAGGVAVMGCVWFVQRVLGG